MQIKLITLLILMIPYASLLSQQATSYSNKPLNQRFSEFTDTIFNSTDDRYKNDDSKKNSSDKLNVGCRNHEMMNFQEIQVLELIANNPFKQLLDESDKRFDLSGIVQYKGGIYVIADKNWDNQIYKIDTFSSNFRIIDANELCINSNIDFEGIDFCGDKFYLIEELKSDVYQGDMISCRLKKLSIPWERFQIDRSNWGNKGFEGIAFDCENQLLYLAKEREPRRIFLYDIKKDIITEPYAEIIDSEEIGYDIGDLKYENGALYILERGRGLVTKIVTKTKATSVVSFQHIVLNKKQRLYNNSNYKFGMAEALMLTEDQIWIGIDNNGDEISEYGKSMGLKAGNKPLIMIFKRPVGF